MFLSLIDNQVTLTVMFVFSQKSMMSDSSSSDEDIPLARIKFGPKYPSRKTVSTKNYDSEIEKSESEELIDDSDNDPDYMIPKKKKNIKKKFELKNMKETVHKIRKNKNIKKNVKVQDIDNKETQGGNKCSAETQIRLETFTHAFDTDVITDLLEDMVGKVVLKMTNAEVISRQIVDDVVYVVTEQATTKERKARPNKRNERKRKYNFGEAYINRKGNQVEAKSVREGCNSNKCKRHCKQKINQDQRNHILKSFWALGEQQKRWNFISKTVKEIDPKQRRMDSNNTHKKMVSRKYMFQINGESVMVCKQFYLDTLVISNDFVITALDKVNDVGFVRPSAAGGPKPQSPHYLNEEKVEIRRHIESFPTVDSHYCRKTSTRKYLSPILSIQEMYRMYQKE